MEENRLSRRGFTFQILTITTKVIRSILFNIFMLGLGFVLGFGTFETIQVNRWSKNQNYECIDKLKEHLNKQRILDEMIDEEIQNIITRVTVQSSK